MNEDRTTVGRQLSLDLPIEPRLTREDFLVSPSNEAAYSLFNAWPRWPDRILLLLGPTGSGKSHLGAIWASESGAATIDAADLDVAILPDLVRRGALLVEDADRAAGREHELFHLINLARDTGCWVVLTARSWPDSWGLSTRDLVSRLRLAPAVEIAGPDDALVRAVLIKLFVDRQLQVDTTVVDYLALRIDRSLGAARSIVGKLDAEAMALRRPVTRPMAADVLRRMDEML